MLQLYAQGFTRPHAIDLRAGGAKCVQSLEKVNRGRQQVTHDPELDELSEAPGRDELAFIPVEQFGRLALGLLNDDDRVEIVDDVPLPDPGACPIGESRTGGAMYLKLSVSACQSSSRRSERDHTVQP